MKRQFLYFPLVIALLMFTSIVSAQDSYVNIYSTVSYDSSTNTVTGYAYTQPSYTNAAYYTTYVNATLYDENGNNLVYSGNYLGSGGNPATVNVSATGSGCGYYRIVASHFQIDTYYVYNYYDNGYYYTGYYDPYYYQYFDGGSGSPIWESFSYFGPGPPTYEYNDQTIFDNTEQWTQGNCNLTPTVTITPIKAVGKDHTAKVWVRIDNNLPRAPITLVLNHTSGTTGSAQFTSSNSNTRTITATGDVEIKGITESSTKRAMEMTATYTDANGNPVPVATPMDFTVVKATLSIATSGSVSSDNVASANILSNAGTLTLGGPSINSGAAAHLMRHYLEIKAVILPADWDENVTLETKIVEYRMYDGQTLIQRAVNCDDTSSDTFLDTDPSPNGNVYDYDAPGFLVPSSEPDGTVWRRRTNFRQWLSVFQAGASGTPIAVTLTDDITWYQSLSVTKVSSSSQVVNTSVTNDNRNTTGSTPLDWNLVGTASSNMNTGCPS